MIKTYILDTNVLIHDPDAIYHFEDNKVIIPIYVIEEIDKLKKEQNEAGRAARRVSRNLDFLRQKSTVSDWVQLDNGGALKVDIKKGNVKNLPESLQKDMMDNRILAAAYEHSLEDKGHEVILVTKDINMRIKADSLGMKVEDYETGKVDFEELYTGVTELKVKEEIIDHFYKETHIDVAEVTNQDLFPNQFVTLLADGNEKKSALTIYKKSHNTINKLSLGEMQAWGIKGKNREQKYAMELLMDDNIKVVTLVGRAGTGKTLLALACALEQVVERKKYKKILVARPVMPLGKDIGFLPGTEKEKLRPWMQPIYDNFEFLCGNKEGKESEKLLQSLESMGLVKIEALTYIRGRSIPEGFLIIDEAQNLTPHEIKTVVTRAGENTKIVFTGDPYQIDNPYLDANSNGLTYLAERFKNEEVSGHVTLVKGERSKVAEIAAKLL